MEHITPRVRQGSNNDNNLACACRGCNGSKGDRVSAIDPQTEEYAPFYNPRLDRWESHFEWDSTQLQLVGRTPTGRATISALQLNRPPVVKLRGMLLERGEHPPIF